MACGAAGRRRPTSREASFHKLTVIGAGAKQSAARASRRRPRLRPRIVKSRTRTRTRTTPVTRHPNSSPNAQADQRVMYGPVYDMVLHRLFLSSHNCPCLATRLCLPFKKPVRTTWRQRKKPRKGRNPQGMRLPSAPQRVGHPKADKKRAFHQLPTPNNQRPTPNVQHPTPNTRRWCPFSSPLACGAAGRRRPTSREAPFHKQG